MTTGGWVEARKRNLENRSTQTRLDSRSGGKDSRKVNANAVPVAGTAFDAPQTIVVGETKAVHGRRVDANATKKAKAIGLSEASVYQGGLAPNVVGIDKAIETVHLLSCEPKNMDVAGELKPLTDSLLEEPGASGTARADEISGFQENTLRACTVPVVPKRKD